MSTMHDVPRAELAYETANDRFKRSFGSWFWGSVCTATVIHFAIFAFFPDLQAENMSRGSDDMEMFDIPETIEIPPPPEQIARPATPVVSTADIDEDITIAPTTFEDNPIDRLPPPPNATGGNDLSTFQAFTRDMAEPEMKNRSEIEQALQRFYPPLLRDSGVGETVHVLFFIDENGRVHDFRVAETSGYEAFDDAATKVADLMQFSPAMNRGRPVRVAVTIPITFRVQ